MTWSLRPAELPSAGQNSKPQGFKRSKKNEGPFENMVLKVKQIENFRRKKKQKHCSRPFKKTQSNTRTLKASIEHGPRRQ